MTGYYKKLLRTNETVLYRASCTGESTCRPLASFSSGLL